MGRATRETAAPSKLPLPVQRNTKGRPVGNVPDGAKPMVEGERAYEPSPPKPRPFK